MDSVWGTDQLFVSSFFSTSSRRNEEKVRENENWWRYIYSRLWLIQPILKYASRFYRPFEKIKHWRWRSFLNEGGDFTANRLDLDPRRRFLLDHLELWLTAFSALFITISVMTSIRNFGKWSIDRSRITRFSRFVLTRPFVENTSPHSGTNCSVVYA